MTHDPSYPPPPGAYGQPGPYHPYDPYQPAPSSSDLVPAPFWRRIVARVLDLAIAVPLTFVAVLPVGVLMLPLLPFLSDDTWSRVAAFLCSLVSYTLIEYFLLRRRSGQTLGKGLLGLRVVPVPPATVPDLPGPTRTRPGRSSAVSGTSALVRMLVVTGPFTLAIALFYATADGDDDPTPVADAVLYLWLAMFLVSSITAVVDRSGRRGLHDLAARTRVVRTAPRGVKVGDLRMLVPGPVRLEKDSPTVTLTKRDP